MLEGLICGLLCDQKFGLLKLDKFDSRSLTIRHFKDPCDITVDISCRFFGGVGTRKNCWEFANIYRLIGERCLVREETGRICKYATEEEKRKAAHWLNFEQGCKSIAPQNQHQLLLKENQYRFTQNHCFTPVAWIICLSLHQQIQHLFIIIFSIVIIIITIIIIIISIKSSSSPSSSSSSSSYSSASSSSKKAV